jgi:hypothetical protein
MEVSEADKIDLAEVADLEEGASGIRLTWLNSERMFVEGPAAARLLERWKAMKEIE